MPHWEDRKIMPNVSDILKRVYGARGLAFPAKPDDNHASVIAAEFTGAAAIPWQERIGKGTPLWGRNVLGRAVFMPVKLGGIELPNPLISFGGEKSIIETDVVEVGTVFEKVFTRPYDITIICTLLNEEGTFPEKQVIQLEKLYREGTLYTLECALTDIFLQPKNNFILSRIDLQDMQGIEDAQVIQLSGRSNVDFQLEIK